MAKKTLDIDEAAKNLFTVLDEKAEFKMLPDGKFTYKGTLLPDAQKNRIIGDAKTILALELWEVIMDDMKQVACRRMYEDSNDAEMIRFGKAMLYTLDVLQKKLYNMSVMKRSELKES